jgi:hypothetical protein
MAKVVVTRRFNTTADKVWGVVGGFATIDEWHPAIASARLYKEGNGLVRELRLADGTNYVIERLEALNDAKRTYTYSIIGGTMPVQNYLATIRVLEDDMGRGALGHWVATFDTTANPAEIEALVQNVFSSGFEAAAGRLGA